MERVGNADFRDLSGRQEDHGILLSRRQRRNILSPNAIVVRSYSLRTHPLPAMDRVPFPLITALLRPTLIQLPLDTPGGWSKIMDETPRYQALFLPPSHLWWFHRS